jgi:Polysaccharide pyruvyl transferase
VPRILFRAGKDPLTPMSPEQAASISRLGVFGSNSGNILFYSSVHRAISVPGAEIVPDGYALERPTTLPLADIINNEFDSVVIPMANSFRESFLPHLVRLTDLVKRLKVPVTVVGVGAQLQLHETPEHVSGEYRRTVTGFVKAVLERSASIGVRGEFTADMLKTFGIGEEQVDVIGCPSIFTNGQAAPLVKKTPTLTADSLVGLNYTPKVKDIAAFLEQATTQFPKSIVVPQTHRSFNMMVWGENRRGEVNPGLPQYTGHPLYLNDRMRFFIDASTWIDYMRGLDFVAGTRLHGNIAGVLAGTPSLLIAHDSRTFELAKYHGIPYVMDTTLGEGLDLAKVYEETDFSSFEAKQPETFERYRNFLEKNDLDNIFRPGKENPEYDAKIEAAPFPPAIHTLMAEGPEGRRAMMDRIAWLRQGFPVDSKRSTFAYQKPFPPGPKNSGWAGVANTTKTLKADVAKLQEQVAKLEGRKRPASTKKKKRRKVTPSAVVRKVKNILNP